MININDERDLLVRPGDTLLETLEYIKMSQTEFAMRMGKTPSKINDIISGKEPITINTALQIEKVLGIDAQFWINMEVQYREKLQRIEEAEILQGNIEWLDIQPLAELKKRGIISTIKKSPSLVEELLKFFGVASLNQYNTIYLENILATDFRKSDAHKSTLGGIAAWLRIGEIQVKKVHVPEYDKDKFKSALNEILKLVRDHPEDFAEQVQKKCFDAGVVVVYASCLKGAPISGAARWVGGSPLIQLSDRYKTNDFFWFAFFHESGHILLHGKKDIFLEHIDAGKLSSEKESEADDFAVKWLLPGDVIGHFEGNITEEKIKKVARDFKTHPGIVLGRLQHLKMVDFSFANNLKLKINFSEFDHFID
jgi:HTH-type transcriptional regulator/antitoxin HigA